MPTITKSIGTSSRDYSTITSWEADLDNGTPYDAGDTAVGECYNDSNFDEAVTIDGGGTLGLAARKLTVASGQRHNGTANTGAKIVRSASGTTLVNAINTTTIEWLEIHVNGQRGPRCISADTFNRAGQVYRWLVLHGINNGTSGDTVAIHLVSGSSTNADVVRNVIYNLTNTLTGDQGCWGIACSVASGNVNVANNTIQNLVNNNGSGTCYAFNITEDSSFVLKNNIGMDCTGTTSGTKQNYSDSSYTTTVASHNLSSDTSASGTGSLTSKSSANQFVSTAGGSENLHLVTGADAKNAGTDLVATPAGVEVDIDGLDINADSSNDPWDMGADEFVGAGPTVMSRWRQGMHGSGPRWRQSHKYT
jgi:hypothetical protein